MLRRFDPATRRLEPVEWPEAMSNWSEQLTPGTWKDSSSAGNSFFIRRMPAAIWESAPAIVVPTPIILFGEPKPGARMAAAMSYSLLMIDRDYVARELLPSLAEHHFGHRGGAGAAPFRARLQGRRRQPRDTGDVRLSVHAVLRSRARRAGRCHRRSLSGPDAGLPAARRRGPPVHGIGDPARSPGHLRYGSLLHHGRTEARPLSIVIQPGPGPGPGIAPGAGERPGPPRRA